MMVSNWNGNGTIDFKKFLLYCFFLVDILFYYILFICSKVILKIKKKNMIYYLKVLFVYFVYSSNPCWRLKCWENIIIKQVLT